MIGQTSMKHKDPVCGMHLEEKDVKATAIYQGKTYYFCLVVCKKVRTIVAKIHWLDKTESYADVDKNCCESI